jgi:hypothetical protein
MLGAMDIANRVELLLTVLTALENRYNLVGFFEPVILNSF